MAEKLADSFHRRKIAAVTRDYSQFFFSDAANPKLPQVDVAIYIHPITWIEDEAELPPEILRYFHSDAVRQSYVFSTGTEPKKPVPLVQKKRVPVTKKTPMKKAAMKKK